MSLPLPLAAAADLFVEQITAYDVVFTLLDGRWTTVTDPDRIIAGVIQPDRDKFQDIGSDGALSDGTLLLHTRSTVSMSDMSQQTGETFRQTYVRFEGEIWKVNEIGNWRNKTQNYGKFKLTKFTDISQ